jgi:aryl-alcohol dehydrogenase-like predicted oxidoreductase
MLGTAQFGSPYGIANRKGQPSYQEVRAILSAAVEGGVNCFDTAADYGASEEILGRALHELRVADRAIVVTKVRPLNPLETKDGARAIERSVAESRKRLKMDCLPLVLFHREPDAQYLEVLERLKAKGWLRHTGVSCDNRPGPARQFVAAGRVAAVQLPGNVLDRRHQHSGVFRKAARDGVAVFIRSVYLQGLLVMPEAGIPAALHGVMPARRAIAAIAQKAGMSLAELALRYMLAQEGVTCVLTGVETEAQIRENLALFSHGPLETDVIAAVNALEADLSETILTPSLWPTL